MTASFIEKSLASLTTALRRPEISDRLGRRPGLLQRTSCRVKLMTLAASLTAILWSGSFLYLTAWIGLALLLARLSQIPLRTLVALAMGPALIFNGVIALPACFLSPGRTIASGTSVNGIHSAALLILRSEASVGLVCLLLLTTPWSSILDTLAGFGAPRSVLKVAGMAFRYILLLAECARDMFESRRSRIFTHLRSAEGRRAQQYTAGVLLQKSLRLSEEVHYALESRGYGGTVSKGLR